MASLAVSNGSGVRHADVPRPASSPVDEKSCCTRVKEFVCATFALLKYLFFTLPFIEFPRWICSWCRRSAAAERIAQAAAPVMQEASFEEAPISRFAERFVETAGGTAEERAVWIAALGKVGRDSRNILLGRDIDAIYRSLQGWLEIKEGAFAYRIQEMAAEKLTELLFGAERILGFEKLVNKMALLLDSHSQGENRQQLCVAAFFQIASNASLFQRIEQVVKEHIEEVARLFYRAFSDIELQDLSPEAKVPIIAKPLLQRVMEAKWAQEAGREAIREIVKGIVVSHQVGIACAKVEQRSFSAEGVKRLLAAPITGGLLELSRSDFRGDRGAGGPFFCIC